MLSPCWYQARPCVSPEGWGITNVYPSYIKMSRCLLGLLLPFRRKQEVMVHALTGDDTLRWPWKDTGGSSAQLLPVGPFGLSWWVRVFAGAHMVPCCLGAGLLHEVLSICLPTQHGAGAAATTSPGSVAQMPMSSLTQTS